MRKTDEYRLHRILETCDRLLDFVSSGEVTRDAVLWDVKTQWTITTPLFIIGEQANCVSREFADAHPEIPWSSIAGLRHRLGHDYEGTNWERVANVLFEDIEPLRDAVKKLL